MLPNNHSRHQDDPLDDSQVALALSLRSNQFTGWNQKTRDQLDSYSGWNYLGITPICRLAARAVVDIFDERKNETSREQAKSLRRQARDAYSFEFGSKWKSFLDEKELAEPADYSFNWWKLLGNRPNPFQSAAKQRWERVLQLHIHGVSMVWNVKTKYKKTRWRFVLPYSMLTPIDAGTNGMILGGVRVHNINWATQFVASQVGSGALSDSLRRFTLDREIPMEDITMTSYPHPMRPGDGMSPSTAIDDWIGAVRAAEKTERRQYERGPEQKVLVAQPDNDGSDGISTTTELNTFQKRLDKRMKSSEGILVAVPKHGQVTPVGFSPDEMGYAQSGGFHGPNIMGVHHTPKTAIGQNDNGTYGSNAASMQAFNWVSVQSDLDLFADDDTIAMQQEEGEVFTAEYTAPEYNDPELQERKFENDVNAGNMTGKEARKQRGRESYGDKRDNLTAGSNALKEFDPANPDKMPSGQGSGDGSVPKFGQSSNGATPKLTGPKQPNTSGSANPLTEKPPTRYRKSKSLETGKCVVKVDLAALIDGDVYSRELGKVNRQVADAMSMLIDAGCDIVVYTYLDAVSIVKKWLRENEVRFDSINENTEGESENMVLLDGSSTAGQDAQEIAMSVVDRLKDDVWKSRIERVVNRNSEGEEYGFLYVPVGGDLAEIVRSVQRQVDNQDWSGSGREDDLHITVMYGMVDADRTELVKVSKAIESPIYRLASKPSVFKGGHFEGKDHVAIVIELEGDGLHHMRDAFANRFAHLESYESYRPHITIGYIKKETAEKYEALIIPNASSKVALLEYTHPGQPKLKMPITSL